MLKCVLLFLWIKREKPRPLIDYEIQRFGGLAGVVHPLLKGIKSDIQSLGNCVMPEIIFAAVHFDKIESLEISKDKLSRLLGKLR